MTRVVVLGSSGFVGANVAAALEPDFRVCGVDCVAGEYTEIEADLTESDSWKKLPRPADAVVNAAAIVGYRAEVPEKDYVLANVYVSLMAARYAAEVGAGLVYFSTAGVYGFRDGRSTEQTPPVPPDVYSLTKYLGEAACLHTVPAERLLVLRISFPYGPGQKRGLIPKLVTRVLAGEPVNLNTEDGRPRVTPLYVDDLCTLVAKATTRRLGGVFNCGGREDVTVRELAEMIAAACGRTAVFLPSGNPCGDLRVDSTRLFQELGVDSGSFVGLRQGLQIVLRSYTSGA